MTNRKRTTLRICFLSLLILAGAVLSHSFLATTGVALLAADASPSSGEGGGAVPVLGVGGSDPSPDGSAPVEVQGAFGDAATDREGARNWSAERIRAATADGRNVTVVATQGTFVSDESAELAAFLPNGTLVYYDDDHPVYFDVDPVEGQRYVVEYVTAEHLTGDECGRFDDVACTRNVVKRVDLTTGEETVVYESKTPRLYNSRWHDVDRLNETTLVVADIADDGVFAVDIRDGSTRWRWNASQRYDADQGGPSTDWTHINDVELLDDGRVMVSVRNMDSVVFLEFEDGEPTVDEEWTLGSEDDYDTLHEQHNPDYIPPERGGPAITVADSENGRVVEYARSDGEWEHRWSWRDARLQWPRDADRLPDGHTLVVDSHGDRVVELNESDEVAWSAHVGMPYDVERLGTGDESASGPATDRDAAATAEERPPVDQLWIEAKDATPSLVANGLLYLAPSWIRFPDLAFTSLFLLTGLTWGGFEAHWTDRRLRSLPRAGVTSLGRRLRGLARRVLSLARQLRDLGRRLFGP